MRELLLHEVVLVLRALPPLLLLLVGCAAAPYAPDVAARSRPLSASSEAIEAERAPRCGNTYRRLCGPGSHAADARATRHKRLVLEIDRATLELIAAQVGLEDVSPAGWRAHLAAQPAPEREALTRLFRKSRAAEVARRVAPLEETVRAEHERLRALALATMRRGQGADARARRRLERAQLAWVELGDDAELPRALRRGCGDHLLVDDAWVTNDAFSITLCPGFLLVSADRDASGSAELRQSIAFLLAHELGHVIVGPTSSLREARAAEVRADAWATRIIAADLATLPGVAAREAYLRRAVEPICAPEGDATHAPGPERIELVLARDRTIASALPCDAPSDPGVPPSGRR